MCKKEQKRCAKKNCNAMKSSLKMSYKIDDIKRCKKKREKKIHTVFNVPVI